MSTCTIFLRLYVFLLLIIFVFFISVNEVNIQYSIKFKVFSQFSRKNSRFQGVSSALEKTFQIPALCKDRVDAR